MLLTALLKVHKRISSQSDFMESVAQSVEVRELKTDLFAENCSEKSPLFIERIKIRAHRGYSAPLAYLPERGRTPCPFLSPRPLPNRLRPCSPQPAEPLRCSLCSPERPRPAINVMHPQTHPRSPRRRTQTQMQPS